MILSALGLRCGAARNARGFQRGVHDVKQHAECSTNGARCPVRRCRNSDDLLRRMRCARVTEFAALSIAPGRLQLALERRRHGDVLELGGGRETVLTGFIDDAHKAERLNSSGCKDAIDLADLQRCLVVVVGTQTARFMGQRALRWKSHSDPDL